MNLQDEIKELKQRIAELEEQVEHEQVFPQEGDTFWYVDPTGRALVGEWEGFNIAKDMLEIGNIFRTEEEAKFAVEKLKVEAELRNLSDSWDLEKTQYVFSFNGKFEEFEIEYSDYNQYLDSYYFDSVDSLKQALETVGEDRIKKYLFGVEE